MPGVFRFLIYYVFLVRMMVNREIMLMHYMLPLYLKEMVKHTLFFQNKPLI